MKTKLFTLLLAVAASIGTMLADPVQIGDLYYNLDGDKLTADVTYSPDGYSGSIIIPSSVNYNTATYSVTSIGYEAFAYCSGLTSVTIPNSVTSIGDAAFNMCSGLTAVTIPNSVTSIGDMAFYGCTSLPVIDNIRYADTYLVGAVDKTLSTYTIKEGTKWIGASAFSFCSGLTSIEIPNSVTSIGAGAFNKCKGLTSVTIPNSVTSIGDKAFNGCSGLTSIYVTCGDLERVKQLYFNDNRVKYAPLKYHITGNVNIEGAGSVQLPQNECDVITAIPKYGYHFAQWIRRLEISL